MSKKKSKNTLIFVYGTLKKGFSNHFILQDAKAKFIAKARSCEGYALYVERLGSSFRSLPYLIAEENGKGVQGEIYEVSSELLMRMDGFEGHPNFYCRTPISATLEDGTQIDVSVYVFQVGKSSRYGAMFLEMKERLTVLDNYAKDIR